MEMLSEKVREPTSWVRSNLRWISHDMASHDVWHNILATTSINREDRNDE